MEGGLERETPAASFGEARRLVRSSTALSVVALLNVGTSFLWDIAIAARFGIGSLSDAFYIAYTLPSTIAWLLYLSCNSILVPAVARRLGGGEREAAWRLFSIVANVVVLVALVVGLGCAAGSYGLIRVLAPGFSARERDVAAEMSMILFGTLAIAVAFEVLRTGLYATNRFVVPTASNVLGNLIIVAFVVAAGPGLGVRSAAVGVAAAKTCQLAVIAPLLLRVPGFRYHWSLRWRDPAVIETLRAFVSPLTGMGARRVVMVVERVLASTLPAGSVTALNYGLRLGTVVQTVFYSSITRPLLPVLAVYIVRQDLVRIRESLLAVLKLLTSVTLPAVIVLVLLREPVVIALFQRGQVQPEAIVLTASVLAIYATGLLSSAHFSVVQDYFYAAKSVRTAAVLLYGVAATNLALDVALIQVWGAQGIAAAWTLSSVLLMAVGYLLMWPRTGGWPWRVLGAFAWRTSVAGVFCALVVAWVQASWPTALGQASNAQSALVLVLVAGMLGLMVYFATSFAAPGERVGLVVAMARRRLGLGGAPSSAPSAPASAPVAEVLSEEESRHLRERLEGIG